MVELGCIQTFSSPGLSGLHMAGSLGSSGRPKEFPFLAPSLTTCADLTCQLQVCLRPLRATCSTKIKDLELGAEARWPRWLGEVETMNKQPTSPLAPTEEGRAARVPVPLCGLPAHLPTPSAELMWCHRFFSMPRIAPETASVTVQETGRGATLCICPVGSKLHEAGGGGMKTRMLGCTRRKVLCASPVNVRRAAEKAD